MVDFADRVRIKAAPATQRLGLAGLEGQVYGWTTPSLMDVEVIGDPVEDHAINVFLDEREQAFWFAPHLVELIDHGAGTVITIGDADKEWVRLPDGEWQERPRSS